MLQSPEPEKSLVVFSAPGVEVPFSVDEDRETLWGTRTQIAVAFGCTETNVTKHIQSIYAEGELDELATSEKTSLVQKEGDRSVNRPIIRYNLDVILAVGYRVSSAKATLFRKWSTKTLGDVITKGYSIDAGRIANDPAAQRSLAEMLRAIRHEEKVIYAKVRDVWATSATDYNGNSPEAKTFFAMAQDKFIYAATGKTAAQVILERADASRANMGLRTIKGERPTSEEARTGKNYLTADELRVTENLCEQFMLFAESKAYRGQKMTMEEITTKLNILLQANDYPVLYKYEKFQRQQADAHARIEHERYCAKQIAAKPRKQLPAKKKP